MVIPCYNSASTLKRLLESLFSQTLEPEEVIVVDDGSDDNISEVVFSFRGVKYIRNPLNRGIAAARNRGWRVASAPIIAFVDADVILDRDYLKKIKEEYSKNENISGVGGNLIELQEGVIGEWKKLYLSQNFRTTKPCSVDMLFGALSSYRREVLLAVGGFEEEFKKNAEDVEIGIRLRKRGAILNYVPYALGFHQRRDNLFSLIKNIFNWYYWGFYALKKHNLLRKTEFATKVLEILREFKSNLLDDILTRKNIRFAFLTFLKYSLQILSLLAVSG